LSGITRSHLGGLESTNDSGRTIEKVRHPSATQLRGESEANGLAVAMTLGSVFVDDVASYNYRLSARQPQRDYLFLFSAHIQEFLAQPRVECYDRALKQLRHQSARALVDITAVISGAFRIALSAQAWTKLGDRDGVAAMILFASEVPLREGLRAFVGSSPLPGTGFRNFSE